MDGLLVGVEVLLVGVFETLLADDLQPNFNGTNAMAAVAAMTPALLRTCRLENSVARKIPILFLGSFLLDSTFSLPRSPGQLYKSTVYQVH